MENIDLGELTICIAFSMLCLLFTGLILSEINGFLNRRRLNVPEQYVDSGDAEKTAKEVAYFLNERSYLCRRFFNSERHGFNKKDRQTIPILLSGLCYENVQLIRLIHSLGCEIIIRQVGDGNLDVENPENTPDVYADKVFAMRKRANKLFGIPFTFDRDGFRFYLRNSDRNCTDGV